MRIAIVSDIHGNLTAFEAVLADLRRVAPDLVLHGGDLAYGGSGPAAVVDRIRDLGWPGVFGNADELLARPEALEQVARRAQGQDSMWAAIRELAAHARASLGDERLAWLDGLPPRLDRDPLALVHASPASLWQAPGPEATDAELEAVYGPLGRPVVVYGHIHRPYVRPLPGATAPGWLVANSGSVGQPHDGDRRAAYLVVDDGVPTIRRVEYDLERELRALDDSGLPHSAWVARTLRAAAPQPF